VIWTDCSAERNFFPFAPLRLDAFGLKNRSVWHTRPVTNRRYSAIQPINNRRYRLRRTRLGRCNGRPIQQFRRTRGASVNRVSGASEKARPDCRSWLAAPETGARRDCEIHAGFSRGWIRTSFFRSSPKLIITSKPGRPICSAKSWALRRFTNSRACVRSAVH
jgi:hypothetical protein